VLSVLRALGDGDYWGLLIDPKYGGRFAVVICRKV
jgi:hypothetical protein